jgi:hypothetical protein
MLALPDVVLTRHLGHFLRPANAENPGNAVKAIAQKISAGSRYFCESLFWASQPKQAAKT